MTDPRLPDPRSTHSRTAVLLDLDGTLVDPGGGITGSVAAALDTIGASPVDAATLRAFVGPPLQDSFARLCGLDPAAVDAAVNAYRRAFADVGMAAYRPCPGMAEVLAQLRARGHLLAVATSKPTALAVQVLDHTGLHTSVPTELVVGATLDGSRRHKPDIVAAALSRVWSAGPSGVAVMVGDRSQDVAGARANALACIGVTWGFGDRAELAEAGADMVIDRPAVLPDAVDALLGPVAPA